MPSVLAVTDAIKTLNQAESRLNLKQTTAPVFFPEWLEDLPELTDQELHMLDRLHCIYLVFTEY